MTQIARAAVAIADRDGLSGLTMEAVAARLECTKMALYRYVRGKEDLQALMFDHALGKPPTVRSDDWMAGMRHWSQALLDRYDRHSWAAEVPLSGAVMTRNRARWLEEALTVMQTGSLSIAQRLRTVLLLNGHVLFTAKLRRDEIEASDAAAAFESLGTEFPRIADALRTGHFAGKSGPGATSQRGFIWGVDVILTGAQATVTDGRRVR